ncbi:MAG: nucleotidyltransferase family protein, partial [Pseudomonadota bacterium]
MKAMVLAAGKGTRVRPITYSVPKPMIPLVRKPVIQSIFEYLRSYSIRDVVINTSYLSDKIESYFGDGDRFGMRMAFSFEGKKTNGKVEGIAVGSAGGMKKIQDHSGFFDETFIVLCGDALIDLDITKAVEFHRERKSIATIILKEVPREETSKYGVVCTDKSGRIVRFQEKPEPDAALSTTVNTGIYIFEPDIFDYIPSHSEYDIGGDLFPKLADLNLPFYGISLPFQWVDIGSVTDYWRATGLALTGG